MVSLTIFLFGFTSVCLVRETRPLLTLSSFFVLEVRWCSLRVGLQNEFWCARCEDKVIGKTLREWPHAFWHLPPIQSTLFRKEAVLLLAVAEELVIGQCVHSAVSQQHNRHHANDFCPSPAIQMD